MMRTSISVGKLSVWLLGLLGVACGGASRSNGAAGADGTETSTPADMEGKAGGSSQQEPVTTTEVLGLQQLAASDGRMVAIAEAGTVQFAGDDFHDAELKEAVIYASDDGAAWHEVLSDAGVQFSSVAAGNGHFAVLGSRKATPNYEGFFYVSEDTQNWMEVALPNPLVTTLVFGNGTFIGSDADHVYVSSDARSWEEGSTQTFKTVDFGAGLFVGTSNSSVAVSKDGRDWTSVEYELNPIADVAVVAGSFVAVTFHDCCLGEAGYTYQLVTSRDGLTWTEQTVDDSATFPVWSAAGCVGVSLRTANMHLASGASCAAADYSLSNAGSMLVLGDQVFGIHTDDHLATSIVTSTDALRWTTLLD